MKDIKTNVFYQTRKYYPKKRIKTNSESDDIKENIKQPEFHDVNKEIDEVMIKAEDLSGDILGATVPGKELKPYIEKAFKSYLKETDPENIGGGYFIEKAFQYYLKDNGMDMTIIEIRELIDNAAVQKKIVNKMKLKSLMENHDANKIKHTFNVVKSITKFFKEVSNIDFPQSGKIQISKYVDPILKEQYEIQLENPDRNTKKGNIATIQEEAALRFFAIEHSAKTSVALQYAYKKFISEGVNSTNYNSPIYQNARKQLHLSYGAGFL